MYEAALAVVLVLIVYWLLYDFVRRIIAAYFRYKLEFTRNLMGVGNGEKPPHEQ